MRVLLWSEDYEPRTLLKRLVTEACSQNATSERQVSQLLTAGRRVDLVLVPEIELHYFSAFHVQAVFCIFMREACWEAKSLRTSTERKLIKLATVVNFKKFFVACNATKLERERITHPAQNTNHTTAATVSLSSCSNFLSCMLP